MVVERYLVNLDYSKILVIAAAATVAQIDRQGDDAVVTLTDPKTKDTFQFNMRRLSQPGYLADRVGELRRSQKVLQAGIPPLGITSDNIYYVN